MSIRKQLPQSEWQGRLQSITSGNRGRTAEIESNGETITENRKLVSVNFDPKGKGDDISIDLEGYMHVISSPAELHIEERDNGDLAHIEVTDAHGKVTVVKLL